jgi:hypothetical protein
MSSGESLSEKNVIGVLANPGLPPSGKGDPFESCGRPITAFCALKRHKKYDHECNKEKRIHIAQ